VDEWNRAIKSFGGEEQEDTVETQFASWRHKWGRSRLLDSETDLREPICPSHVPGNIRETMKGFLKLIFWTGAERGATRTLGIRPDWWQKGI
jgi:hypothetical protein